MERVRMGWEMKTNRWNRFTEKWAMIDSMNFSLVDHREHGVGTWYSWSWDGCSGDGVENYISVLMDGFNFIMHVAPLQDESSTLSLWNWKISTLVMFLLKHALVSLEYLFHSDTILTTGAPKTPKYFFLIFEENTTRWQQNSLIRVLFLSRLM